MDEEKEEGYYIGPEYQAVCPEYISESCRCIISVYFHDFN